jgi:DNA-binding transcriptional LysR family regulator
VKDYLSSGHIQARVVAEVQDIAVAGRLASEGFGVAPLSAHILTKPSYSKSVKALKWKLTEPIYESLYLVSRNRQWPNPLAMEMLQKFRISK